MPAEGVDRRKKNRAVRLKEGLQEDAGATCACRKALHVAQLFLWHSQRVIGSYDVFVCHVGGKKNRVELTKDKEDVIKISDAHTFNTETSLPNSQARAILKPLPTVICNSGISVHWAVICDS